MGLLRKVDSLYVPSRKGKDNPYFIFILVFEWEKTKSKWSLLRHSCDEDGLSLLRFLRAVVNESIDIDLYSVIGPLSLKNIFHFLVQQNNLVLQHSVIQSVLID